MSQEEKSLVLVVDDHEPAAQMVSQIFITRGYNCDWASDGEAALEKARRLLPDLILLDVMMPGMDGWEFLQHYQKLPPTQKANIVMVMLTTSLNPDDEKAAQQNIEISGFENKPLQPTVIKKILNRFFPEVC